MDKEDVVCVCVYIYTYIYTYICIYIYTHNGILAIEKNEILPFSTTWLDLEYIMLSKISQKEKDKYHTISLICGIYLKEMIQMNLFTKQKPTCRYQKQMHGYQTGNVGRRINQALQLNTHILLYIRKITNKDLLYSTGNSTQYSVITYLYEKRI